MKRMMLVLPMAVAVLVSGCQKSTEQKKLEEAAKEMGHAGQKLAEGAQGMADAMKELNEGKKVEPVDFRELKALLPESLAGLTRANAEGERTAAMGVNVAFASAQYTNESGTSISVKISDMGSLTGAMRMATLGWTMAEIDRETDDGYEKTTSFNGHKAWEKYGKNAQHGDLSILVEGRFLVEVNGDNCEMNQIKDAAGKVDLTKLASMKNVGVTS
jgi:hypothetical protein